MVLIKDYTVNSIILILNLTEEMSFLWAGEMEIRESYEEDYSEPPDSELPYCHTPHQEKDSSEQTSHLFMLFYY